MTGLTNHSSTIESTALEALVSLTVPADHSASMPCPTPLVHALPEPRGYPLIAYVTDADMDRCQQRPGQRLRLPRSTASQGLTTAMSAGTQLDRLRLVSPR